MSGMHQMLLGSSPIVFTSYVPTFTSFVGAIDVQRLQVIDSVYVSDAEADKQTTNGSYYTFSAVASGSSLPAVLTAYVGYLNDTLGQIRVTNTTTEVWDDYGLNKLNSYGTGLSTPRSNPGVVYQLYSDSNSSVYSGYYFKWKLFAKYDTSAHKYTFYIYYSIGGAGAPYANTVPTNSITISGVAQYMMPNNISGTLPTMTQVSFPIVATSARYWRLYANDVSWTDPGSQPYYQEMFTAAMYQSTDATGTDVSLGATSTASTDYYGQNGYRAHDGDLLTYWRTTGSGVQWLQYTFGSPVTIKSLAFRFNTAGYFSKSYKLQYSSDNSTWYDLVTIDTQSTLHNQKFLSLQ
jgi:hypothetical protein